jgi:hypothetical protein
MVENNETNVYSKPFEQLNQLQAEYREENEKEIPAHSSKILF